MINEIVEGVFLDAIAVTGPSAGDHCWRSVAAVMLMISRSPAGLTPIDSLASFLS